jgi:hypothetical protein
MFLLTSHIKNNLRYMIYAEIEYEKNHGIYHFFLRSNAIIYEHECVRVDQLNELMICISS